MPPLQKKTTCYIGFATTFNHYQHSSQKVRIPPSLLIPSETGERSDKMRRWNQGKSSTVNFFLLPEQRQVTYCRLQKQKYDPELSPITNTGCCILACGICLHNNTTMCIQKKKNKKKVGTPSKTPRLVSHCQRFKAFLILLWLLWRNFFSLSQHILQLKWFEEFCRSPEPQIRTVRDTVEPSTEETSNRVGCNATHCQFTSRSADRLHQTVARPKTKATH